ncbi:MAG: LamG-like jellyroll fold domain-containing protein, partial [Candidatus Margulisiibacteriota bacterium]
MPSKRPVLDVAIIGGGVDTYTKLMLHMDGVDAGTTFTDSVGTHTVTAVGTAQTDTAQAKFGVSSGLLDGNSDYLTIPDHADFNMGTGTVTIDFWVRFNSVATSQTIFYQETDATHYVYFTWSVANLLAFKIQDGAGALIDKTASFTPVVNTWYHIALIRGWGGNA